MAIPLEFEYFRVIIMGEHVAIYAYILSDILYLYIQIYLWNPRDELHSDPGVRLKNWGDDFSYLSMIYIYILVCMHALLSTVHGWEPHLQKGGD